MHAGVSHIVILSKHECVWEFASLGGTRTRIEKMLCFKRPRRTDNPICYGQLCVPRSRTLILMVLARTSECRTSSILERWFSSMSNAFSAMTSVFEECFFRPEALIRERQELQFTTVA